MEIYAISISYRYDKFRIYQHRNLLTSTVLHTQKGLHQNTPP